MSEWLTFNCPSCKAHLRIKTAYAHYPARPSYRGEPFHLPWTFDLAVIVALLGFAHNNRDLPRPAISPASPVQEQRPNAFSADPQVYETILVALGKPGPAWAHWLDKLESDLIATGTSPSDARTAILTVIRDTRVPDGWAIEMVRVSRDIGAVMGTGIVSETRLLTQAVATGYEGYRQYSLTRGLDAGDVKTLRDMLSVGDGGGALDYLLKRLNARFAGKYEQLRSVNSR